MKTIPKMFRDSVALLIFLLCQISVSLQCTVDITPVEDDACLNCTDLIRSKGFDVEEYSVTTSDGYILLVLRIPGRSNSCCKNQPHLLVHGLLSTSDDFFDNFNDSSIGFSLANAGCDVWALNFRGNTYSRRHVSLNPSEKAFWQFTWDEMALFDLPAVIDFIRSNTGFQKINLLGYSQGGGTSMALLSDKPIYNNYVNNLVVFAPAVFIGNLTGYFRTLIPAAPTVFNTLNTLHQYEFFPDKSPEQTLLQMDCSTPTQLVCKNIINGIGGPTTLANWTRMPVFTNNFPAGSSINNMEHYVQMANTGKFRKYDLGLPGNLQKYGQAAPPDYNLGNVNVPITIFSGMTDYLVTPKDIDKLLQVLGSKVTTIYRLPPTSAKNQAWDHFDFALAPAVQYWVIPQVFNAFGINCA